MDSQEINTNDLDRRLANTDFAAFDDQDNDGNHIFIGASQPDNRLPSLHMIAENNAHPVVVGSTGSHKTTAIVIPNILWKQRTFVAVDPKGEIAKVVGPYLRSCGFEIVNFDPYQVGSLSPDAFDPVAFLDPSDPEFADKINQIVEALLLHSSDGNPHWVNSARNLLAGVIAYVVESDNEASSLIRAHEIVQGGISVVCAVANSLLGAKNTNSLAWRKLARYVELTPDNREAQSILSTLLTQLQFLDSEPIRKALSHGNFRFEELLNPHAKLAVFITLPPDKLETHNRFQRLLISQVIATFSQSGGTQNAPVDLYIDEAGTIGALPILSRAVGVMRSYGLRIWTIFQTVGQLKRDYPRDYQNFIGNSGTLIMLKVSDNETAKYFSERLGKIRQLEEQRGLLNGNRGLSGRRWNPHAWNSDKAYPGMHDMLSPEALCQLPDEVGLVLTDGTPALFMKTPYFETSPFRDAVG
nr:type IV secretory system conjugative DNA transfer family protein [uncultured Pseudodesulfovibrio sp.]